MALDLTINWIVIFTILGTIATCIGIGWRLYTRVGKVERDVEDAKTMARAAEAVAKLGAERHAEFKEHVATHYASNKATEAMEGRIIGAVDRLGEHIDRMGERIDRLFDPRKP
jgi:hypothetical protein